MHTIIYTSEATPSMDSQKLDLNKICEAAVRNNNKNNITGVLLFHNNHFLQVLEGNLGTISSLVDKISADSRHSNLEIIYNNSLEKRNYPNWEMQLFDLSDSSKFSSATLKTIKEIYNHNFQFNSKEYLFLIESLLKDKAFLDSVNTPTYIKY